LTAFVVEIVIATIQGRSPLLRFYVTNYDMLGNSVLGNGVLVILICVIGNIINVIMENGVFTGFMITVGKKRHSFFVANGFYSSFLFGLWHSVMPLRNFIDGNMTLSTAHRAYGGFHAVF
jgi:membrane protease YdiL (CAAX protease family)